MRKALTTLVAATLATGGLAAEPIQVTAPGPEGDLAGVLIPPAEGQPVVLIVPGSGPTDRDGNSPLGITAASYRLLAEALAAQGVGSLRVDKRGMFGSKGAIPDPNAVTIGGYADDVAAWTKVAQEQARVECVWVMGHSEGGMVALEAAISKSDICGVLLVASVGRRPSDTIREQLRSNPANAIVMDEAMAALESLEAGDPVDTAGMHPGLMGLFAPAVQGFLIDMFSRDPGEMIGRVDLPILIVAGGKDIQTPLSDANALAEGQPEAELIVIEDMNHVLKAVDGEGRAANLAVYSDPSVPIHSELVGAVASFVRSARD